MVNLGPKGHAAGRITEMRLDFFGEKVDEARMSLFLFVVAIAAMLAVVAVLFAGVVSMARGGEFNARWGNRLMRWRVMLQAVAIVALLLVVWAVKGHH
jgi:hypothetical protein